MYETQYDKNLKKIKEIISAIEQVDVQYDQYYITRLLYSIHIGRGKVMHF